MPEDSPAGTTESPEASEVRRPRYVPLLRGVGSGVALGLIVAAIASFWSDQPWRLLIIGLVLLIAEVVITETLPKLMPVAFLVTALVAAVLWHFGLVNYDRPLPDQLWPELIVSPGAPGNAFDQIEISVDAIDGDRIMGFSMQLPFEHPCTWNSEGNGRFRYFAAEAQYEAVVEIDDAMLRVETRKRAGRRQPEDDPCEPDPIERVQSAMSTAVDAPAGATRFTISIENVAAGSSYACRATFGTADQTLGLWDVNIEAGETKAFNLSGVTAALLDVTEVQYVTFCEPADAKDLFQLDWGTAFLGPTGVGGS